MKKKQKRKTNIHKSKSSKSKISTVTIAFLILSILITYSIVSKGLEYDNRLFTWSFIALFLGLLFESYFILENLNSILNCFSISFFVSLTTFLLGKSEKIYNLQRHIKLWPYFFLISFIIGIIITNQKKVTIRQTEGTTLLQSIAIIYWLLDSHFFDNIGFLESIILILTTVASLFTIINALTKITLTETNRLLLSVWSSIILMCLAINNVFSVFSNGDIDQQSSLTASIEVGFQYFFVGISSVYVVQNVFMLFGFLPEKNMPYKQSIYVAKSMHLDRYSDTQVEIMDAVLCICYCLLFFILNSNYQIVPSNTMIWFVIVTFPYLLLLRDWLRRKKYS